jgi:hypothetical protein
LSPARAFKFEKYDKGKIVTRKQSQGDVLRNGTERVYLFASKYARLLDTEGGVHYTLLSKQIDTLNSILNNKNNSKADDRTDSALLSIIMQRKSSTKNLHDKEISRLKMEQFELV